jgi:hypothetical protein
MMKSSGFAVSFLGMVLTMATVPASADVLYSNVGPTSDGGDGSLDITTGHGWIATDSFTLSQTVSIVDGANFDIWLAPGDPLTNVDWSIGTSPFGGTSATATTTGSQVGTGTEGVPVFLESIAIPDLSLGPGTYWFTLQNAVTNDGFDSYWDVSYGPSTAFYENPNEGVYLSVPSETFNILSATSPEPASFLLLGSGLAGLAFMIRRKVKV